MRNGVIILFNFRYQRAASLEEALALQGGETGAHFLAGGTNLMLRIKHGQLKPAVVIAIGRLKELQYIREEAGFIRVGAGVKISELIGSGLLGEKAHLLITAAREIASPEVRNMATVGGNICSAGINCGACGNPGCPGLSGGGAAPCRNASSADLIPPLLALGAGLRLAGRDRKRDLKMEDFLPGGRKTALNPGEILEEIYFPPQRGGWGYSRLGTARAMGVTVVAAAVTLVKNRDRSCGGISLALGGSFEKPVKVSGIEQLAVDRKIDRELIAKITAIAGDQLRYTESLKMPEDYRRLMTGVLIREAIEQARGDGHENSG